MVIYTGIFLLKKQIANTDGGAASISAEDEISFGGRGQFVSVGCQTAIGTSTITWLASSAASSTVSCAADRADSMTILATIRSTSTPNALYYDVQASHDNITWFNVWNYAVNDNNSNAYVDSRSGTSSVYLATSTPIYRLPILDTATTSFAIAVKNVAAPFIRVRFNIAVGDAAFWAARIDRQPEQ